MSATAVAFKNKYWQSAIEAAVGTKVFPETILTAAALESGWAKSSLASKYYNFFGIKADSTWKGKKVYLPTKEQTSAGKVYTVNAAFRWYDNPAESFRNYVKFISGPRYVKAGVLNANSPTEQFAAIKKAGYATDVNYVTNLQKLLSSFGDFIERNPAAASSAGLVSIAAFFLLYNVLKSKK